VRGLFVAGGISHWVVLQNPVPTIAVGTAILPPCWVIFVPDFIYYESLLWGEHIWSRARKLANTSKGFSERIMLADRLRNLITRSAVNKGRVCTGKKMSSIFEVDNWATSRVGQSVHQFGD
jgi:hypothetical protein